jgi:hypothetical protein
VLTGPSCACLTKARPVATEPRQSFPPDAVAAAQPALRLPARSPTPVATCRPGRNARGAAKPPESGRRPVGSELDSTMYQEKGVDQNAAMAV